MSSAEKVIPVDKSRPAAMRLALAAIMKEIMPYKDPYDTLAYEAWCQAIDSLPTVLGLDGERRIEFMEACGMPKGVAK